MAAALAFSTHVAGAAEAEFRMPTPATIVEPHVAPDLTSKEGEVTVLFRLDQSGRPLDIEVVSATNTELVEPVRSALRKWRFEGGPEGEKLESARYRLPFIFSLEG